MAAPAGVRIGNPAGGFRVGDDGGKVGLEEFERIPGADDLTNRRFEAEDLLEDGLCGVRTRGNMRTGLLCRTGVVRVVLRGIEELTGGHGEKRGDRVYCLERNPALTGEDLAYPCRRFAYVARERGRGPVVGLEAHGDLCA